MKENELKLIAELMKNSRRSDRELAKAIGTSQPTATRIRRRLEKEGYIKEYTMIPDFVRLGYGILAFNFANFRKPLGREECAELHKRTIKMDRDYPTANLLAMNGIGLGKERISAALFEDYTSFAKAVSLAKQIPNVDSSSVESFVVDLKDETHFRSLTLSAVGEHLLTRNGEK